jgi:hypothetical protein
MPAAAIRFFFLTLGMAAMPAWEITRCPDELAEFLVGVGADR